MTFEVGQKVYARRNIWIHEVFSPALGDNYVVVDKDEPGEITDLQDDGRMWVLFEDDEWLCERNMIAVHPSIQKRYVESLLIDNIAVYFIDRDNNHIGEIIFRWKSGELNAEIAVASFGAVAYAQDIFSALAQKVEMEYKAFVDLLNQLGYVGDEL